MSQNKTFLSLQFKFKMTICYNPFHQTANIVCKGLKIGIEGLK